MANEQNNSNEINLSQLSQKARDYFSRLNDSVFDGLQFIKRNIIILAVLLIAGAVLGYFKDIEAHVYNQEIFAIPNFNSTDYVYGEVERLNSKIKDRDTVYLKQLGIKNTADIVEFKIEPVPDLYNFIDQDKTTDQASRKFEVLRLVSENGDAKTIVEDPITGKNFKTHLITVKTTKKFEDADIVAPLFKHFNANPYYSEIQKQYVASLNQTIAVNDTTLKQIDGILNDFASGSKKADPNLVYYNDNSLGEVLKQKGNLLAQQASNRIARVDYTDVVKNSASLLNVRVKGLTSGKMKIFIPLLFIFIFLLAVRFKKFYTKQAAKRRIVNP